jgi:hypothetical protein
MEKKFNIQTIMKKSCYLLSFKTSGGKPLDDPELQTKTLIVK